MLGQCRWLRTGRTRRGTGPRAGGHALYGHVRDRLPGMAGELVLFLSAAVFASGLRALMDSGPLWLPFTAFGVGERLLPTWG